MPRRSKAELSQPTANRELASRIHPDDALDPAKIRSRSRRHVTVNLREHPLDWLRARGLITATQHDAGERLRADYERSNLGARVTMDWSAAPQSRTKRAAPKSPDASLLQLDAKRRFDGALNAVGAGLSDICWRIICANEPMGDAEKSLGWPARSGRVVLTLALDRLADYYGCSAGSQRSTG